MKYLGLGLILACGLALPALGEGDPTTVVGYWANGVEAIVASCEGYPVTRAVTDLPTDIAEQIEGDAARRCRSEVKRTGDYTEELTCYRGEHAKVDSTIRATFACEPPVLVADLTPNAITKILPAVATIPERGGSKHVSVSCDSGAEEVRDGNVLEGYNDYYACDISDLDGTAHVHLKDVVADSDTVSPRWLQKQGAFELREALPVWEFHPSDADPLVWRKTATLDLTLVDGHWTGEAHGRIRLR